MSAAASWDMATNNFGDAYRKLQRAVELQPNVAAYHVGAGLAAAKLGKTEEAAKRYTVAEQMLSREAQHKAERVADEAMVLVLLGRTADATRALKEGAARFPDVRYLQILASDPAEFIAGVRKLGSAEDGAVNGSQPLRPETNRTSSAAGSRR